MHYVSISPQLKIALEAQLKNYPEGPWLFPGEDKTNHWSGGAFDKQWGIVKAAVGIDKRFHDLRHCAGTYSYESTGDIYATAEFMDHKDINQTKRYARRFDKNRNEEMEKFAKLFE